MSSSTDNEPTQALAAAMREVDWQTFARIAADAEVTLPVEQTAAWDSFDAAVEGRQPWGRVVYQGADGRDRALVSLTRMTVRGFPYLWARHAPVWLGEEPTPQEEAELRRLLVAGVRHRDPRVVFVRLHAAVQGPDCHELLQTMTYDRTVVLDLDCQDDEAVLASFKSRGRRDVRKALRHEELTFHDETDRAQEVFSELYEILTETGERDGFRPAPESVYRTMLRTLGPDHARLYVARRQGQEALVWSLVTVYGDGALRYYAGSSAQGRRLRAADALVYKEACWLRAQGVRTYDLMGVDSPRVPELAGVREFKNKFVTDGPVDVPGAWDVPVHPRVYAGLVRALGLKRTATARLRGRRSRSSADASS
ncbi:lipid II:glycine glycyltransferase FemX [Actinomyces wuliandei]|uniref:lipid II:glycine glycyltransferase FemX n=1 Tax=Actinomyces wuliandei TaxID=2057743 RepID=UPI000FDBF836|nr:GNAT family N-acetyltransferase [Actinomyces wuliandei]